jgi:hypothetical protein
VQSAYPLGKQKHHIFQGDDASVRSGTAFDSSVPAGAREVSFFAR